MWFLVLLKWKENTICGGEKQGNFTERYHSIGGWGRRASQHKKNIKSSKI